MEIEISNYYSAVVLLHTTFFLRESIKIYKCNHCNCMNKEKLIIAPHVIIKHLPRDYSENTCSK